MTNVCKNSADCNVTGMSRLLQWKYIVHNPLHLWHTSLESICPFACQQNQARCMLLHMLSLPGQECRIYESPDRGWKVWDNNVFRFWQRGCQLAGSQDFPCQVIHEAALAPAAQESEYTWTLKGRSSTSLTAYSGRERKSGNAKRKSEQLLWEKNWGKSYVCCVEYSMSITFTSMGWPCENGNSSALLGLEILMIHFSLWVQLICLKSIVLLFIVYVVLSTAEMNCFLNLFKYIQTRYNGGTCLTDSYDNDFPLVTFVALTESQYFTAEPIFTALLSWAELAHVRSPAGGNKTACFWVPCKIKAVSSS